MKASTFLLSSFLLLFNGLQLHAQTYPNWSQWSRIGDTQISWRVTTHAPLSSGQRRNLREVQFRNDYNSAVNFEYRFPNARTLSGGSHHTNNFIFMSLAQGAVRGPTTAGYYLSGTSTSVELRNINQPSSGGGSGGGGNTSGSSQLGLGGPIEFSLPSANKVRISINRISNLGNGSTGSLRVRLYAFEDLYNGGSLSGAWLLASQVIGTTLSGNQQFVNWETVTSYTRPSFYGRFFTTVVLSEFNNGTWWIRDYYNLPGSALLGLGNPNRRLPQFGEMQPGSHPRWYIDPTLGYVFISGNGHWTFVADLNEWIHADPGGLSWSPVFGRVRGSGTTGWLSSNVFGWVHFGSIYAGWVHTDRFGWMWRQQAGDTTWLWSASNGWLGVANDGSNFLWSVDQSVWLAPLS